MLASEDQLGIYTKGVYYLVVGGFFLFLEKRMLKKVKPLFFSHGNGLVCK